MSRFPLPMDAVTIASFVSDVVGCQDAPPRVVAPLIEEMNRHASARVTIPVYERLDQRFDIPQHQGSPLKKQADFGVVADDVFTAVVDCSVILL